ncbi:50S ribosomal protein L25 [Clostridium paraputrificum]|uniref:50S ribosomal protein L25 n=1 Tax=Clostridium TaxID=1485 RepID=UPI003D3256EC
MTNLAYKVSNRTMTENIKQLRRDGQLPGIIYGEFLQESIPVKMPRLSLVNLLKNNSKGSIIPIDVDNKIKNCVVKEVQKNNIGEIIHIDFQYVKDNEIIKMNIPVKFIGQENLESRRLVLQTQIPTLEFQGPVEKIPEYIQIDVSTLNFEDKVLAKDIKISDEIVLITDENALLAVVNA